MTKKDAVAIIEKQGKKFLQRKKALKLIEEDKERKRILKITQSGVREIIKLKKFNKN